MRLTLAISVLFGLLTFSGTIAAPRPNIIYILSDDMGYSDIGCYGSEIETPHLDSIAKNGLRLTQFYNTGRCCPTRASLLTGVYPHQAGIGHMMSDYGSDGYRGDLSNRTVTLAEVLKGAGYGTYMIGKWHVTPKTEATELVDQYNWPLQRGFDRFYGTIHGAGSLFDPNSLTRGNRLITPDNDPEYQAEGTWYYTDAIVDNTIRYIEEHDAAKPDDPFFAYVAFTAAHWPMHALPEDIEKYEGRYDEGYRPIREARIKRLRELQLLSDDWEVVPQIGNWDEVEDKEWESACMEVYAAMVDRMDQGIGRILETLETTGRLDNTLICYFQDNGGCAEKFGRNQRVGPLERPSEPTLPPMGRDELQFDMIPTQSRDGYPLRRGVGVMPGPAETQIGYGLNWANVSNTPFREYKHWVHEGGAATPFIVQWPAGISKTGPDFRETPEGLLHDAPTHLIDLMATAVDLAGAEYPTQYADQEILPMEGVSLKAVFEGNELDRSAPIFFEHEGNRAVRDGRWKLVAKGVNSPWELYDMVADRTEMNNLAELETEIAGRLADAYETWADRAGVLPFKSWQSDTGSSRTQFRLSGGDSLAGHKAPSLKGKAFQIEATVVGTELSGVIAAQGGSSHGWVLWIEDGAVNFMTRTGNRTHQASAEVSSDMEKLTIHARAQKHRLSLRVGNDDEVEKIAEPLLESHPEDGLEIGRDGGGLVARREISPFSGSVEKVKIQID